MRDVLKQFVVWVTVASVWAGAAGVAFVPVGGDSRRLADDGSEWYACMDHVCGCLSAEMCRTACCCVKPVEVVKACCEEEHEEDAVAVEWRVVIKSAECSGHKLFMSLKCGGLAPEAMVLADCLRLGLTWPGQDELRDQVCVSSLPFDPPPPRHI